MNALSRWWARAMAAAMPDGGQAAGAQAAELREDKQAHPSAQGRPDGRPAPPRQPRDEQDDFDGNFWGW